MAKDQFRREVEKELTGKDTEPSELVYFKLYKSQIPVVEQAIETAALMLGSDKSRGYCLEMICADFLAGANLDHGNIPLMFYLPNPIRGGISAFRVEDDVKRPPDFLVLRKSVEFVYWPAFLREMRRYDWEPVSVQAPDIVCGNCPDPVERYDVGRGTRILVARRVVR